MNKYPKTKKEAKAQGNKFYKTGKYCVRGHVSKRYTSNGMCEECRIFYKGAARARYRHRMDNDPEFVKTIAKRTAKQRNKQKHKDYQKAYQAKYQNDPANKERLDTIQRNWRIKTHYNGDEAAYLKAQADRAIVSARAAKVREQRDQRREERLYHADVRAQAILNKEKFVEGKVCKRCNTTTKYTSTNSCYGCCKAKLSNNPRIKAYREQRTKIQAARAEAMTNNKHLYEGMDCIKCGSTTRYVSGNQCVACSKARHEKTKAKRNNEKNNNKSS